MPFLPYRYTYYGNIVNTNQSLEEKFDNCGLTILKPAQKDIGLWICKVVHKDQIHGGFLRVTDGNSAWNSEDARQITADDVFVKVDDDFLVNYNI